MPKKISSSGGGAAGAPLARQRSRISRLDRTLRIIDYLLQTGKPANRQTGKPANRQTGEPASIYKIAKTIEIPTSTAYALIDDLVRRNLLTRDHGTVWLGSHLLGYGLVWAGSLDLLELATENMRAPSVKVEATGMVCTHERDSVLVLAEAEPESYGRPVVRAGTRLSLN